jgi:hypothetical protein
MRLRFAVVVATLLLLLAVPAAAADTGSTTVPTVPPTLADGRPITECISSNPPPDCPEEHADGHTLVLFGVLILALTGIGVVVVRSTLRNSRARNLSRRAP